MHALYVQIGDIVVEIKVPKKARQLTNLRGQVMQYCRHFDYVLALIFDYSRIPIEALHSFTEDMKELYGDKVRVIIK